MNHYIAKLVWNGAVIVTRHVNHPSEAHEALGGVTGPGYSIVVESGVVV